MLRPFEVTPRTVRIEKGPKGTAKGYVLQDLLDAFYRNLDQKPEPAKDQKPESDTPP
jgi:hypothetical protein